VEKEVEEKQKELFEDFPVRCFRNGLLYYQALCYGNTWRWMVHV